MCEFCAKHGEGEKWYLQAKNYSDDLLNDARRRKFFEDFSDPDAIRKGVIRVDQRFERLGKAPKFIRDMISRVVTRKMKKVHFGQVVPLSVRFATVTGQTAWPCARPSPMASPPCFAPSM